MSDKNMTLTEFLEEYVLFEKPQKYDAESGLSTYELMCDREKRQKRQELFESLILRIDCLFDLWLLPEQIIEKSVAIYREDSVFQSIEEKPIFENLNILEQELFRCLLQDLPKVLNGTDVLHSLKMYDWRKVPEDVRMKLLYYIKGLIMTKSSLFDNIGDSMQIYKNACLKLENPEAYFFKKGISVIIDSQNLIVGYPPKFLQKSSTEVDKYNNSRNKALEVIEKKIKQLLLEQNKIIRKLDKNLKDEHILQAVYKKEYKKSTTSSERKAELELLIAEIDNLLDDSGINDALDVEIVEAINEQFDD